MAPCRSKKDDDPNKIVALKVQKSAETYTSAAKDEISLLQCVANHADSRGDANLPPGRRANAAARAGSKSGGGDGEAKSAGAGPVEGAQSVIRLLDEFSLYGPNGMHKCLVFEPMGENLLHLIKRTK